MGNSWKPVVQTDDSGKWYDNALRFATQEEALASARDLFSRWLLVREYGAQQSDDPVKHGYVNGELKFLDDNPVAPFTDFGDDAA